MNDYNGILLIDKPAGFTSFDVVAKLRGIARTRKIGHAGTLDPMATGVLPLFFGRAAKACDLLPRQDKAYAAVFQLGITTDTQDITGKILRQRPVTAGAQEVCAAAAGFLGEILQIPPMYSALKVNGQKLCDLARRGVEVKRKARPVTVHAISCAAQDEAAGLYRLEAHCSKGTYIRTLVQDIGETLGCGATMTALRRRMAAGFSLEECVTLEQVQRLAEQGELAQLIRPVECAFAALPKVTLTAVQSRMLRNGVSLDPARVKDCPPRGVRMTVYREDGLFLGLACAEGDDLRAIKLFSLEG